MRRLINGVIWLTGLVVLTGVYFFVPVGHYTLYEHTLRIAATEPAQELSEDLADSTEALGERAMDEWDEREGVRHEARGELHIDPDADGRYRVEGQEPEDPALDLDGVRARIESARADGEAVRAILEGTDDAPSDAVTRLTRLLEREEIPVEIR